MAIPPWKRGIEKKEEEPIPQPVRSTPRWKHRIREDTRAPDVPKGTVVSRASDKPPIKETALEYLIGHADPIQSGKLEKLSHVPYFTPIWQDTPWKTLHQTTFQIAGEQAHRTLTPGEQEEFGYQYTEWEKIPVEKRKFYPGGTRYFESLPKEEKRELGKQFYEKEIEEGLGAFDITEFGTKWAGEGFPTIYSGSKDVWKEKAYEYMFEKLSTPSGKLKDIYFSKLPAPVRWYTSGSHAAISWAAFPITLPQTGVKLLTGGKTFFPDVSKSLERHRPGSPLDVFSVGISEGIGYVTGKGSDEWERFMHDPISGAFATVGAGAGLLTGTAALKAGVSVFGLGFKSTVKYMPKICGKVSSYTGTRFTYLTGGRFAKAPTFGTKIGQTKFWSNIHDWSTGEKVFVKTYPLVKGYPKTERVGDAFARIYKWKGFGKHELVPRSGATPIEKSVSGYFRYTRDPRFEFRVIFEDVSTKGLFKKTITQKYSSAGVSSLEKGVTVPYYIKGQLQVPYIAMKKAPVISKGFWKDTTAYQTLVPRTIHARPMISGGMHHTGFLGGTVSIPTSGLSSLSMSALGLGFGLSQVGASAHGQRRDIGRVQQPDYASILKVGSAYDVLSIQDTDMAQIQKQLQRQKSTLLSETVSISALANKKAAPLSTPYHRLGTSTKIPVLIPFDFEGGTGKKKKKTKPIDWTKGYRERKHDVLTMEEVVGGM